MMHDITTCGRGLSHGSRTGTPQGKLSSKGAFIDCLSMLYLTFSMDKSSHPHLMLKTCLLLPSHSTAQQNFTFDSSWDGSEKHVIIFSRPPQDQSKCGRLQGVGALWRCYTCISLVCVWGAQKQVRLNSSVTRARHSPAHPDFICSSCLLFTFLLEYTVCRFLLF